MAGQGCAKASRRPEVFWAVFVLVCAGAVATLVVPARREHQEAGEQVAEFRRCLEARRRRLEDLRAARAALESGDPAAWEAVARAAGWVRPGELPVRPAPERRVPRGSPSGER